MNNMLDAKITEKKVVNETNIVDFIKKTNFDDKLNNISKKVTLNKSQYLLVENELNELSEKVKLLSIKSYNSSLWDILQVMIVINTP